MFLQLGPGVDDETWRYHLERGVYSRWIRQMIKDAELANQVADVGRSGASAEEARGAIRDTVANRYTAAS